MINAQQSIIEVFISGLRDKLEVGSTIRSVCPFCGGGDSFERSFSFTRTEEGYVYNCFRDSCLVRGGYKDKWSWKPDDKRSKIPSNESDLYWKIWNIWNAHAYGEGKTVIYEGVSITSVVNGFFLKRNFNKQINLLSCTLTQNKFWNEEILKFDRKATVKRDPNKPCYYDYFTSSGNIAKDLITTIYFTEDVLSANQLGTCVDLRVSNVVALLGTSLSYDLYAELCNRFYYWEHVVWCLDPDTWNKPVPTSVVMANKVTQEKNNKFIRLQQDPKDTPVGMLKKIIDAQIPGLINGTRNTSNNSEES